MRTRTLLAFGVGWVLGVVVGFWVGRTPHRPETLAAVLEARGVSPETITRFRFVGDESSFTGGRVAVETDVSWIWDGMIATAEPYGHWLPSGYRRVEVFTRGREEKPAAVLLVNETDATHVEGDSRSFMCHGLEALAMHLLSSAQAAGQ